MLLRMLLRVLRDTWTSRKAPTANASNPVYSADVFDVDDLQTAKRVILNPMPDMTTGERWEVETSNLVDQIGRAMGLDADSCLLDYGCGIGRVAKALIERYGCSVVGVDISARMRGFAVDYVNSDRFAVREPAELDRMMEEGFRATGAYACWVLQHCSMPRQDIRRISAALPPGALVFVLNSETRWIPTDRGWCTDGVSIEELLVEKFEKISKTNVSDLVRSEVIARECYAMLLRRNGDSARSEQHRVERVRLN